MDNKNNSRKYEMDMCNGPLFQKIVIFYIPLMFSGVLQLLFNAADMVVVGKFAGDDSLAAVGSTSALINLIVSVFMGLSVGANVMVARYYGGNQEKELKETVHTAISLSMVCGCILVFLGILLAKPALVLMGTPDDVLKKAVLYMSIYFAGMPVQMTYNFGAAILRAIGDTKRPLYYLFSSGVINVILNLFFVIILHMDVAGVALATIISQTISAILVLRCLAHSDGPYKLFIRELKIYKDKMIRMMRIGLPAGLQGSIFSISNVLIQSSVNSFGKIVMAGNTAAQNIEGFVYIAMNSMQQASITFTSQNLGANKKERINKTLIITLGLVTLVGLSMGNAAYLFGNQILRLYSNDTTVIGYGIVRLRMICTIYFLCGIMDVIVGSIRGLGYSIMPMIVSLTGACLLRVVWIYTIFQKIHTLECLYISYPISWAITFSVHLICYICIMKHLNRTIFKRAA